MPSSVKRRSSGKIFDLTSFHLEKKFYFYRAKGLILFNRIFIKTIKLFIIAVIIAVLVYAHDHEKQSMHAYYPDAFIFRIHKSETDRIYRVYQIFEDHKVSRVGQIVNVNGYKSDIELLVIIDTRNNTVERVILLKEHESEDYGEYIRQNWYLKRFHGKTADMLLDIAKIREEKENDVVIVTGATISSAAVVYGVNLCIENYNMNIR